MLEPSGISGLFFAVKEVLKVKQLQVYNKPQIY